MRVTAAVALVLVAVIGMNVALILNLSNAQSDEIGNTQLDVIRSDLEDTITEAETNVLRVAIGAEQRMEPARPGRRWPRILTSSGTSTSPATAS